MIAQSVFSYQTPVDCFNFVFVRTHSNDMTSIRFTCVILPGVHAETTPKHAVRLEWTQLRAFKANHVFCPILRVLWSEHFAICIKKQLARGFHQCPDEKLYPYIHNDIQNHYSKIMMISQKMNFFIYTYIFAVLRYPTGRAVRMLIMRGWIRTTDIVYLTTIGCFYFACFLGLDFTHMQSFLIDYSWSYETILHVWFCHSGNLVLQHCVAVTPHERQGVTNQSLIYCLLNSMPWLRTIQTPSHVTWPL